MNHLAMRESKPLEPDSLPLLDILRHDFFTAGYIDVAQGLNVLFFCDARTEWFYERGRAVATEARNTHGRVPPLWCETDAGSIINPQIISLAGAMFMTGAFA